MRHSMAWPCGVSARSGSIVSRSPRGDPNLPLHQIEARHHLGDRVLDLEPRVHLEEVERSVRVEQELDRAGVGVADRARPPRRPQSAMPPAQVRIDGDRRRFLDDLLMAALDRALALDERNDRAVADRRAAGSRCAAVAEAALEVHGRIAECGARFRSGGLDGAESARRATRRRASLCRRRRQPPSRSSG